MSPTRTSKAAQAAATRDDVSPCTAKAAHPATTVNIMRMMGLTTAAQMLGGQPELAEALGIQPRSLRSKLSADRGVSNDDLIAAAVALEMRAERIINHARKLRDEAAG